MLSRFQGILFFVVLTFTTLSNVSLFATRMDWTDVRLSEDYIRSGIESMPSIVDVRYESDMVNMIHNYVRSSGTPQFLERSELYFPMIEHLLETHGMPDDLKYLAVIESHLEPRARSYQGAKGIWQFMPGTARMMGLKVNRSLDQRMDPWASTEAALSYLQQLHDLYDDWSLAMAAYNCGPGNVNKAIRKSGKNDYWGIRPYLPRETRRYLPKFIAATYFLQNLESFNFYRSGMQSDLAVVKIFDKSDLPEIASLAHLPVEEIVALNAAYLNQSIPASTFGYNILVPYAQVDDFIQTYTTEYPERRKPEVLRNGSEVADGRMRYQISYEAVRVQEVVDQHHRVRSGDNLYDIGRSYGISVSSLKALNGLRGNLIHPGKRLLIRKKMMVTRYLPKIHSIPTMYTSSPQENWQPGQRQLDLLVQDQMERWNRTHRVSERMTYDDVRKKCAAYLSLMSEEE